METLNPVEVERQIIQTSNEVAKSIVPVSKAYDTFKQAELDFKLAYALAFKTARGSIEERKQEAIIQTANEAQAVKDAEVIFKRLSDYQKAYRDKLSAFQTLNKSVMAMYNAAGVAQYG